MAASEAYDIRVHIPNANVVTLIVYPNSTIFEIMALLDKLESKYLFKPILYFNDWPLDPGSTVRECHIYNGASLNVRYDKGPSADITKC